MLAYAIPYHVIYEAECALRAEMDRHADRWGKSIADGFPNSYAYYRMGKAHIALDELRKYSESGKGLMLDSK